MRRYLTSGNQLPASIIQAFVVLLQLDEWLASTQNQPTVAALNSEVTGLLVQDLHINDWGSLRTLLAEIYHALWSSALMASPFSMTQVLGWLTRLRPVVALVDTLRQANTSIQASDEVYNALRWRTPVLPYWVVIDLVALRLRNEAVLVRKPGFADPYIAREEWGHLQTG